jgi:hypothetical protein
MFSSDVKPRFLKPGKCHIIQNSNITLVLYGFETLVSLSKGRKRRVFASRSEEVIAKRR